MAEHPPTLERSQQDALAALRRAAIDGAGASVVAACRTVLALTDLREVILHPEYEASLAWRC